ncbi:MAG: multicopper oxidase family protein [Oryzihumus sp.]
MGATFTRRAFAVGTGTAAVTTLGLALGARARGQDTVPGGLVASRAPLPAAYTLPFVVPPVAVPVSTTGDTDVYEVHELERTLPVLPGLATPLWTYAGSFPGPTIVSTVGRRTVVRHTNELPVPVVMHLHGGHVPAGDDGFPTDVLLPVGSGPVTYGAGVTAGGGTAPGSGAAHLGPSGQRAGGGNDAGLPAGALGVLADPAARVASGTRDYVVPPQPRAATLWYHDHWMGATGRALWRGLMGFHLVLDPAEDALGLPTGERDLPVLLCDRAFGADGTLTYPVTGPMTEPGHAMATPFMDGVLGDVVLVNGVPWPRHEVAGARHRLRLLNGSNARAWSLALDPPPPGGGGLVQVASDGGLLRRPLPRDTIRLAPGERCDVVVDFARYRPGARVQLVNRAGQGRTRQVMLFVVGARVADPSRVPSTLASGPAFDPRAAVVHRSMAFQRWGGAGGTWTINGDAFAPDRPLARPVLGQLEVWHLSSDVSHPVHLHLEQFEVLGRGRAGPGPDDHGWKDTVSLRAGEEVAIAVRFTDYAGRFVVHCHNAEHEDMGMMATFVTG